jgi:hypothetical protein
VKAARKPAVKAAQPDTTADKNRTTAAVKRTRTGPADKIPAKTKSTLGKTDKTKTEGPNKKPASGSVKPGRSPEGQSPVKSDSKTLANSTAGKGGRRQPPAAKGQKSGKTPAVTRGSKTRASKPSKTPVKKPKPPAK